MGGCWQQVQAAGREQGENWWMLHARSGALCISPMFSSHNNPVDAHASACTLSFAPTVHFSCLSGGVSRTLQGACKVVGVLLFPAQASGFEGSVGGCLYRFVVLQFTAYASEGCSRPPLRSHVVLCTTRLSSCGSQCMLLRGAVGPPSPMLCCAARPFPPAADLRVYL